jgi:hypothetical protein
MEVGRVTNKFTHELAAFLELVTAPVGRFRLVADPVGKCGWRWNKNPAGDAGFS